MCLVNLAPFIGSLQHSNESIPCDVLAIDGTSVEVTTLEPFRRFSLWVSSRWIDSRTRSFSSAFGIGVTEQAR